jgi:ferredoxin--NADP+ reductase
MEKPALPSAQLADTPRPERRRDFAPNATIVERDDYTPLIARYVVRPDGAVPPFEPGQYFSLGVEMDGRFILRPYSTASPRGTSQALEFLIRHVTRGLFTPVLWQASVGDRVWLGPPKGFFTLTPADRRTHLLVSSGTGIAPFMSMLGDLLDGPPLDQARSSSAGRRIVVAHGVSYASELSYRSRLEREAAANPGLVYAPTVSRPDDPANDGWPGRTGRIESILTGLCHELQLDPADTVAYLCGNPEMVARSREILRGLGLAPEAIVHENYWPATATATAT